MQVKKLGSVPVNFLSVQDGNIISDFQDQFQSIQGPFMILSKA